MKIFIASDIHGSAKYCRLMLEAFKREDADKLVLLGDILYHGPRNPLPEEYSPMDVAEMLSSVKEKIICVRGNCDAEIDEMLLPFPLVSSAAVISDDVNIYLAHGHKDAPVLAKGSIYVSGHTHVPSNEKTDGVYYLNPGSVSLPKEDSAHGYIVYEDKKFTFKNLKGEQYDSAEIKDDEPEEPAPEQPVLRKASVVHRKVIRRRR